MTAPTHWTYSAVEPSNALMQGDILKRTPALEQLLKQVHPYFTDLKYLGFVVVTQSCDLVRRKGDTKAPHISLAPIVALDSVVPDLLTELCGSDIKNFFEEESQGRARALLERIFNQNEQALGVFYLHPDSDAGVDVSSLAMLRTKIAFRAQHYDLLVEARGGRLETEFGNKLGWLTGNLYSRIATPDWAEKGNAKGLKELIDQCLATNDEGQKLYWVPKSWLRKAQKESLDLSNASPEEAYTKIQQIAPQAPKKIVIERVRELAAEFIGPNDDQKLNKLIKRLENDQAFAAIFANR